MKKYVESIQTRRKNMKNKMLTTFFALSPTLLMADSEAPQKGQNFTQTIVMISIAVLFFYFIFWRPEKKRKKLIEERRSNLKKGDKVTVYALVGIIDEIREHTVILKNVDGSKIEVLSDAVDRYEDAIPTE